MAPTGFEITVSIGGRTFSGNLGYDLSHTSSVDRFKFLQQNFNHLREPPRWHWLYMEITGRLCIHKGGPPKTNDPVYPMLGGERELLEEVIRIVGEETEWDPGAPYLLPSMVLDEELVETDTAWEPAHLFIAQHHLQKYYQTIKNGATTIMQWRDQGQVPIGLFKQSGVLWDERIHTIPTELFDSDWYEVPTRTVAECMAAPPQEAPSKERVLFESKTFKKYRDDNAQMPIVHPIGCVVYVEA